MRTKKIIGIILTIIIVMTGFNAYSFAEQVEIAINNETFPDVNFRNYVLENFDSDKNNLLSVKEIEDIKSIDVNNMDISSIKGIEYFKYLEILNCSNNNIENVDLSSNINILSVFIGNNKLNNLDVSSCKNLRQLNCQNNVITSLNLRENKALTYLSCSNNQLTSIDLSYNINLSPINTVLHGNTYLLDFGKENSFDLSNLPGNFDVSKSSDWEGAQIKENILIVDYGVDEITYTYDLGNGNREQFKFLVNKIEDPIEINDENFPDTIFQNYIKNFIDKNEDGTLTKNEILSVKKLDVSDFSIMSLKGIEFFKALETLDCSGCSLLTIDLSGNPNIREVDCSSNILDNINVNKNTCLEVLDCSNNRLPSIDVKNNKDLNTLDCSRNMLCDLDVSNNLDLYDLNCSENFLLYLNIGENKNITSESINTDNNIYEIKFTDGKFDLSQLNNGFDITRASNWTGCSIKDNVIYIDDNKEEITFDYDIGNNINNKFKLVAKGSSQYYVIINANNFPDLAFRNYLLNYYDLDQNKIFAKDEINMITNIDVNGTIKDLKGIENFYALEKLSCSQTKLSSIDLRENKSLVSLDLSHNNLTCLDLSNNINLQKVSCENNEYCIEIGSDNSFDINELPGDFNITKAKNWDGATVEGNILKVNAGAEKITYTYDLGNGIEADFTLLVSHNTEYNIGDVNMDNAINIHDVTLIQKYLVSLDILNEDFNISLADTNDDGIISITDATVIQINMSNNLTTI